MSPKPTNPNPDFEPDLDPTDDNGQANAPANDNGQANTPANDNGGAITPAPKASALASTSLSALAATFKNVDTTPIRGRPIHPLMQFKSREGGVWMFGVRRTIPEPGSLWAVNPSSFSWGWVCWGDASKTLGEKLVPVDKDLPDVTKLPDTGFPWQPQMAVSLKCISGSDAGVEVVFKTNTEGGKGEVLRLIEEVGNRLGAQHEGKVVPIVQLEASSYGHAQYGKTHVPVLSVVDWMPLDGPAPAPEPVSPPPLSTEQPRRRRVS